MFRRLCVSTRDAFLSSGPCKRILFSQAGDSQAVWCLCFPMFWRHGVQVLVLALQLLCDSPGL